MLISPGKTMAILLFVQILELVLRFFTHIYYAKFL